MENAGSYRRIDGDIYKFLITILKNCGILWTES